MSTIAGEPAARGLPIAARLALALLKRIEAGTLEIRWPNGQTHVVGAGPPGASIALHRWSVLRRTLRAGDIGFAEAYLDGDWSTPDLATLLTLLACQRDSIAPAVYGKLAGVLASRVRHLLRANSRRGSRRNIVAHYDLGNAFYRLWLDPSMTYSSALFAQPDMTLEAAQAAKLRRAFEQIAVGPGASILEIGCGWGAFAALAVRGGAQVHGISLSRAQLEAAPRDPGVHLEYRDYRDTTGEYDAVVSIEMVEAVGERYWPDYFRTIRERLRPGGRALVQAITIDERLFERYRRGTDFIQRYIFPGGMLASPQRLVAEAAHAGLELVDRFAFGADYAETLRRWRATFEARLDEVRALGFDERFIRLWRFYLAYSEAAFESGSTDVAQYTFRRP